MTRRRDLGDVLRILAVTDGRGDSRRIVRIVDAACAAGVRAVQVREPGLGARELAELCAALRARLQPVRGVVLVNDRADVAAAGLADGVHLGRRSLPAAAVRRILPAGTLLGVSAHDARELAEARRQGADYATLSPVLPTTCKPGARPLGVRLATRLSSAAGLPVLWLGGLDAAAVRRLGPARPRAIAVRSALFEAEDPGTAAAELVSAMGLPGEERRSATEGSG